VTEPSGVPARLAAVRARIAAAACAAGRDPASVRLVAVSKTKSASLVREAYAAGQRDFGENYVQEFLAKRAELADLAEVRWHAIGHLQTNKARDVAGAASVVHTVDSVRLATELGRRAAGRASPLEVLVQVNVGGEAQKSGCAPAELSAVLAAVAAAPTLALRGLMTVPPHTDDPAGAQPYFATLAALRAAHGGVERLPELSIGMTHDLEVAVACGATIVRVGSAIFGERPAAG
jgi:pyridoxal phosphate enzyme (YggS family)